MLVTEKGQVTIPKHIRAAAGVLPGSEVSFSCEPLPLESAAVWAPSPGTWEQSRSWTFFAATKKPKPRRDEVAAVGLAGYDGSAGVLSDTNVWIDCIDEGSRWHGWAVDQLQASSEIAPLHVNSIIYTELLAPEPDVEALNALLDIYPAGYTSYFPRLAVLGPGH